jgi:hypothetical protein
MARLEGTNQRAKLREDFPLRVLTQCGEDETSLATIQGSELAMSVRGETPS